MGEGGVACMPLQQQQHIMERFPNAEKTLCGGNNGNGFSSKSLKFADTERRKKVNVKKVQVGKSELGSDKSGKSSREVENGDTSLETLQKEEVEEGELVTLKWPIIDVENVDFMAEKSQIIEIEKGEIVNDKWKKSEVEKGEIVSGKWRKDDVEKGEFGWSRGMKDDIEKGEFIPDRWYRGEIGYADYGYSRMHRYQSGKDKGWKNERELTPPSGRYLTDDFYGRKDFIRSGSQHYKTAYRWESGHERHVRSSSKIVDEEGFSKNENSNFKNHGREYLSGNQLKRQSNDSDGSERRHHGDHGDYPSSKSRRLSDDSTRTAFLEHYSHRSGERSYKNYSRSSKISADKYISRHHEFSLSSRAVYDRSGRSPVHSERSPGVWGRYNDYRDQTPVGREKSPYGREKSPYGREKSPYSCDKSPYNRARSSYDRNGDRSREKSPYSRDYRNRSPSHAERSPQDRARLHDHGNRTPNYVERSPLDRNRQTSYRETSRKSIQSEKVKPQYIGKVHEDKHIQRDSNGSATESHGRTSMHDSNVSDERKVFCEMQKEEPPRSPVISHIESLKVDEPHCEELPSMEEDMDICNTPPHVPVMAGLSSGKWFYLDHYGVERGPNKFCELRTLVDEGLLASDHLIKHLDSDRWMTVENAASPLITVSFPSIVSDTITQLVSPPEAPGNLSVDTGDYLQVCSNNSQQMPVTSVQLTVCPENNMVPSESVEDLNIDERVGTLLEGYHVIPGREIEMMKEVLQMNFEHSQWDALGNCEVNIVKRETDEVLRDSEAGVGALSEKDIGLGYGVSSDWYSVRWPCKGGDWKRNDDAAPDRYSKKKTVLNDGFLLCKMPKSGYEDPRWLRKDDLYFPSDSRRLDAPPWAFSFSDEQSDCSGLSRSIQSKLAPVRGVKGTVLSVVRINACVVKDQGSFVSEPRQRIQAKERYHSRSRPCSSTSDTKRSSAEDDSQSKTVKEQVSQGTWTSIDVINFPKDRLCTVDDLHLHLGEWYYLDGSGREQGPSSFSEVQVLVDEGIISKYTSVFRKFDKLWVPVTSTAQTSVASIKGLKQNSSTSDESSGPPLSQTQGDAVSEPNPVYRLFHNLHPQFIGYTRGKLHELVMRSYKSREFAAAINEVLNPWINARQPKKEIEKHIYWKSDGDTRAAKRVRMLVDESEEDYKIEEVGQTVQKEESTFEDLCGDTTFFREENANTDSDLGSWGLLDGHMLARVFHFLRSDIKSLVFASLTCKHWRAALMFYKDISRQVDLSSLGHTCTDSIFWNIMNGYEKEKMKSVVLMGCTNITSDMLERMLISSPCLSTIDIRGCSQFGELAPKFTNVKWIKSRSSRGTEITEDSHSKIRSLKHISEKTSSASKAISLAHDMDDFGALKDYFDSVDKRDTSKQLFRGSLYKRSKLYDARRSSSILSRDARTRRWAIKKSENGYKRMEEYLASSLKGIMKENTFDFFVHKVAEIEDKIKSGYYSGRGLSSVKEDISRMCRDAIKAKNRGDGGDMNHIITLFIQLATRLEKGSKSVHGRDVLLKSWEDDFPSGFCSSSSKYKKKLNKLVTERKYSRINGTSFANGFSDSGEYASDREIRRRLSKLNKKSMDSESETSDDLYRSSDSENTTSDTESDLEVRTESQTRDSRGDGYFLMDFMTDDREWGARMTKASLVPPVTRKYEVIDKYVVIADKENVERKMRVSLPDDYAEKLSAQKNGTEESDMELPEVKDYKPRKQLGDEVIEQEVYGIDPFTHNLLLDSMPEELDWTLLEKHLFIEDVLLCTLNKQVRNFTGTGNTPMMYPLQPVLEEIKRSADEDCDGRTVRMCQGILKAMDSRPDEKYVAYRKGLGVVCNKEGGFSEDDFVVEFLGEVYPVWKWFEKQDGIRSLQKNSKEPAPEFYNIYLERPKGDADGYDLVVVDAMHKANYASRICHSCRPNCEAKVTAVDGRYQIGIYTVRKIQYGEEISFDYHSVTESKEEYEASVCLCGSQVCRGSYLNLTGEGAFEKVLKEWHGILDRYHLMVEACELNTVSEEDYNDLGRAGLGSCLLGGLPDWLVAYSARLVRFINFERTKLPEEILKHNLEEKRKYFSEICLEVEKSDAEVQAEGVYNQRLQNLAVTLDKVRYVMRCVFGDPRKAPPPLEKLSSEAAVSFIWNGEGSFVEELLQCMAPHVEEDTLDNLKSKIQAHGPSDSDDIQRELQKSLLWLRDEVRNLPCTYKCRHDAAADLIHIYAYTKCFVRIREYKAVTSPPVYISPLDLGPKYTDKMGAGFQEYCKTYGENYCLSQLIFWYNQCNAEPECSMARTGRGCLSLPDIGSFYTKVQKPSRHRVYGPMTVRSMVARMEKHPQRPWPKDQIWLFKSSPRFFGSPMLEAVLNNSPLDKEMVQWLKQRPTIFQAMWDQ
ncbi:histone-lysine N-methyltransferase ATXR3 [Quillaja saponaria]|uniref:Histone-lysine N-methyltransferase ATXR3 n=1 Tax=Quillaja saponaria TaxID=32244 RepID=A0AAD7QID0_QUISA|nr:histone-lysine N-methyltransferase ATXR3 [Quillaja saponaria]